MATLSDKIDLARALFGTNKTDAPSVNRISGTATANSENGTVTVQLEDGDVVELGTIGSVRSGQTVTIHVQGNSAQVVAAEGWGDALQDSVDEAVEVANATGQHFWEDDNGAHVTEVTREEWEDSSGANYHAGYNSLWNSLGLLFRKALNNLVAITQSAVSFYDGNGNNAANVTASFGSSGAQVGKSGDSHLVLDSRSLSLVDYGGSTFFEAVDMRDSTGHSTVVQEFVGDGSTTSFSLSPNASTTTGMTVSVSDSSGGTVTKYTTRVEFSTAPTSGATITVTYDTASDKMKHYTLGTRASGSTGGEYSVAMGNGNAANGTYSVAEGSGTAAYAPNSHAMGNGTIASGNNQLVIGQYNAPNPIQPFIVGNGGSSSSRQNALTVGLNGRLTIAGEMYFGSTSFADRFTTEMHSESTGSISAGGTKWVTVDCAKTGWKLLGPVGYYFNASGSGQSGSGVTVAYALRRSSETECQAALKNNGTAAANFTLEVVCLYVKVLS